MFSNYNIKATRKTFKRQKKLYIVVNEWKKFSGIKGVCVFTQSGVSRESRGGLKVSISVKV